MRVESVERLGDARLSEVLSLVRAATEVDKVSPLSEQVMLAARGRLPRGTSTATTVSPHLLAFVGTRLAGYAHLEPGLAGEPATAELVVGPACRRRGVGTALIHALEDALEDVSQNVPGNVSQNISQNVSGNPPEKLSGPWAKTLRLWSHGQLEPARAFALRDGYTTVRELWQMCRSLRAEAPPLPAVSLPEGFRARPFVVGQDEDAWLRVNALAFVDHPEQGRMTRQDLDLRIAEPWFDARGLILIEDARGAGPVLAASHWTKVVPAEDPEVRPTEGEVYVVGVDPAYQGLGMGRAVTLLGLAYLREQGLTDAMLYVDADNRAAVATYSRLGFTRCAVDVMYSATVHQPVQR